MSLTKLLCAALTTAVAGPALLVAAAPSASAACPTNEVGRLQTVFNPSSWLGPAEEVTWYMRDQNLTQDVGLDSDLVVELAVWPMDKGGHRFTVEAPNGPDFMEVAMSNGKVSLWADSPGATYRQDVLTYQPGAWNNLRIKLDLDQGMAHVSLNGQKYSMPSSAGSQINQVWFHNSYRTQVQDTGTAYLDNLSVTKVNGGERTTLYSEDFEDGQAGGAPSTLTFVDGTWTFAEGSGCRLPATLTVTEKQTSERIVVAGSVAPAAAGRPVTVQLLKKKDGAFVPVGRARRLTLDFASAFRTAFDQPTGTRKCRTTVVFDETPTLLSDEVTHTFAC